MNKLMKAIKIIKEGKREEKKCIHIKMFDFDTITVKVRFSEN